METRTGSRAVKRVGILTHPRLPETRSLAADLAARLGDLGVSVEIGTSADVGCLQQQLGTLDCLITLGGDGSIVRAARTVAGRGVPVLGINLGQLGFLAELEPTELDGCLEALVQGNYRIEERMLLRATLTTQDGWEGEYDGLNDVVVARGEKVRAIAVEVWVDGQRFTTYRADGVIVATATGSTAYALAVGGPILAPTLDNLIVIPVAPHLTPTRALVLPGQARIRLVVGAEHVAVFSVDGQVDRPLGGGDAVDVTGGPSRAGFVRFGAPESFYGTLFRRLRWATQRK
ncbi:MAG: NAD(+)/NADH kinase [Anaerolineae bacterium]